MVRGCQVSTYNKQQAYTVGISYQSNPNKVYEFATVTNLKGCSTAEVKDCYGEYVTVKLVYIKEGITTRATKWRSGGVVTQEQRNQFGIKEEKVVGNKLSVEEVQGALEVIRKLQRDIVSKDGGSYLGTTPSLFVSKVGEVIPNGVSLHKLPQKINLRGEVKQLVNFVYEDDAKTQARERLAALEKEAAEIRKLLS